MSLLKTGTAFNHELKKGSAALLVLALLEHRPRHGYEIAKLIGDCSHGTITLNLATLYPLLYQLEKEKLVKGAWVEKAGQRRRRYYQLTESGKGALKEQRGSWLDFVTAVNGIVGVRHA